MNFLKTSLLSGISTIVKMLSSIVINKIIAIYIGPTGIALIGQFQNFLGIITTIGNGAISSGVTKYVAEYNEDIDKRNIVIKAAFFITFICSFIFGAVVFAASTHLSQWVFNTKDYSSIFRLLGIALLLIGTNTLLLSIINGLKQIKLFIIINITSSLLSLCMTSILTIQFELYGALLSLVIVQAVILTISLPITLREIDIKSVMNQLINREIFNKLFAFSIMAIVSILTSSVTLILIRNHLISRFSLEQAGYWQAIWQISGMYLLVLTTALSTYYLPRLSEIQDKYELKQEILSGYKIILPFVLVSASGIYFFRDFIIEILFTAEFREMRSLFLFQLLGDFVKMASWTLAYLMVAKAMTKTYVITEILFSGLFYLLTIIFTELNGIIGVTQAHLINYSIYLGLVIVLFRKSLFFRKERSKA